MRRYVQQLTDHYAALAAARHAEAEAARAERAAAPAPAPTDDDDEDEDEDWLHDHFADVDAYLEGPRPGIDQPLAHYAEIDLAELPPADTLSEREAEALYDALHAVIQTHGHSVDVLLADDAPANLYYGYLLGELATPTRMMSGGFSGHGCELWAPGCRFGRYCCSLELWYKEEFVEQGGDPAIEASRLGNKEEILAERAEEAKRDALGVAQRREKGEWEGSDDF